MGYPYHILSMGHQRTTRRYASNLWDKCPPVDDAASPELRELRAYLGNRVLAAVLAHPTLAYVDAVEIDDVIAAVPLTGGLLLIEYLPWDDYRMVSAQQREIAIVRAQDTLRVLCYLGRPRCSWAGDEPPASMILTSDRRKWEAINKPTEPHHGGNLTLSPDFSIPDDPPALLREAFASLEKQHRTFHHWPPHPMPR